MPAIVIMDGTHRQVGVLAEAPRPACPSRGPPRAPRNPARQSRRRRPRIDRAPQRLLALVQLRESVSGATERRERPLHERGVPLPRTRPGGDARQPVVRQDRVGVVVSRLDRVRGTYPQRTEELARVTSTEQVSCAPRELEPGRGRQPTMTPACRRAKLQRGAATLLLEEARCPLRTGRPRIEQRRPEHASSAAGSDGASPDPRIRSSRLRAAGAESCGMSGEAASTDARSWMRGTPAASARCATAMALDEPRGEITECEVRGHQVEGPLQYSTGTPAAGPRRVRRQLQELDRRDGLALLKARRTGHSEQLSGLRRIQKPPAPLTWWARRRHATGWRARRTSTMQTQALTLAR